MARIGISKNQLANDLAHGVGGTVPAPTSKPAPAPASKPSKSAPKVQTNVVYGLHQKGGGWLGEITNFNNSNSSGFAGLPSNSHDLLYMRVTHGALKYRVHTIEDGWLGWVTNGNKNDTVNGCAGISGHTIDGVQAYFYTPSGEVYQQAHYRSQTAKRAGWLAPVVDDSDFAGIFGEPLDRLQVAISDTNPF
ncbi:endolysin [Lactococcus phage AM9]|uniref:Endolysin n=1 Tax=Lactococcus phage AM9 TaxID=1965477 RepID=A0A1W6JM27_9CAUD|nr:endolysin [Lactococcus phage AM9]